jgi:hypothetical protein
VHLLKNQPRTGSKRKTIYIDEAKGVPGGGSKVVQKFFTNSIDRRGDFMAG